VEFVRGHLYRNSGGFEMKMCGKNSFLRGWMLFIDYSSSRVVLALEKNSESHRVWITTTTIITKSR
jgi:hypothetical protein